MNKITLDKVKPAKVSSTTSMAGADPEILKRGGALCRSPWLANEENFRFQMV